MTTIKTRTISAAGNDISYLEKGEGPLFLCLHGFPDHAGTFRHQLDFFARQNFRVVAPYMRGYGPALKTPDPTFAAYDTGSDALALIEALGEEKAIILGHDWGASAAYAAAYMAPERVSHLITAAVPYSPKFMQALLKDGDQQRRSWYMFFFLAPFAEAAVTQNNYAFIDRLWAEWSPGWEVDQNHLSELKDIFSQGSNLTAALSYYRDTFGGAAKPGSTDSRFSGYAKKPIDVPTLYLHGQQDGCITPDLSGGMEALFSKGLTKQFLDGAGHFLHLEKPDLFNSHISQFLKLGK
ncbi:MAG: alpha/beta hydrolase [Sneathiella sp.]